MGSVWLRILVVPIFADEMQRKETSASTSFGWLLLEVVFYVGGAIL
jgi:hypothetical protein